MSILRTFSFVIICLAFYNNLSGSDKKPKEVNIPCQKEGLSDASHFRASSSAKSKDMNNAKDKAIISAKQMLASLISSTIVSVTDNYISSTSSNNEFKQSFESITRETVNQQINRVSITCQQVNKTKDGFYEAFVAVEMPKTMLIDAISSEIEQNEKLRVDFDKNKFMQVFDNEMQKLEKQ